MESHVQLWSLSLFQAKELLRSGQITSVQLTESVLNRIDATEPVLHAYVSVASDEALQAAVNADRLFGEGQDLGPLQGITICVKDIFDQAGWQTRCGSRAMEGVAPAAKDATSVAIARAGGAVLVGKVVTQEFAAGVVSAPARNPWNPDRIPGGSSGGTAAAVAAHSAVAGFGSDTGGSIRTPAAVCGVVGLKPTFDTIPVAGVYPLSWSLDTVGCIARTVIDTALMFEALTGSERFDASSLPLVQVDSLQGKRIGVSRSFFFDRLQSGVADRVEEAIAAFAAAGAVIVDAPWQEAGMARAAGFIINRVETATVHERGIALHPELFGDELRYRLYANSLFPALGYMRALKARPILKTSIERLFAEHRLDALLEPAAPGVAVPADDLNVIYEDGSREPVGLAYTRLTMPFNLTGQPVVSLPCGLADGGLPVALQLAGRPGNEIDLCRLGVAFEQTTIGRPMSPPMEWLV